MRSLRLASLVALVALRSGSLLAADMGTAFTYQGSLENPPGTPLSGTCTIAFKLCDDGAGPCAPGTVSSHPGIDVVGGAFTVPDVDFGTNAINGTARWLEITVNCGNPGDPITLSPRQELTPAPHALALPGLYTQETSDSPNIIGGLHENLVAPGVVGATISGGGAVEGGINRVTDNFGAIGGGAYNETNGDGCTVGGGIDNRTSIGDGATVSGGYFNTADDYFATVSGGVNNFAGYHASTVGGGNENTAGQPYATVGGGDGNVAGGTASTVPGGSENQAEGDYSLAAGRRAKTGASDAGTFAWADSTDADFTSTGPNQFLVRASGGVGIGTNAPAAQLDVNGAARATTMEITGGSPHEPYQQPMVGWGENNQGQTNVPPHAFFAVGAGADHTVAIRNDGTLVGWGCNNYGQINVPSGTFISVIAGGDHCLAIRSDGTLVGWGKNEDGQTDVPSGMFTAVAAGSYHSLAIRDDGTLAGWGDNVEGEIDVPAGTFIAVSADNFHSVAIRDDGTLIGWGQLSGGSINVPIGTFVAVAAGWNHCIAIRSDGTLAGWGTNGQGQIDIPTGTFTAVTAGVDHSIAIRSDGTLIGWSNNDLGQINVPSGTYTAVVAGNYHSLAIRSVIPPPDPALRLLADSAFKPGSSTWTIYSDRRLKKDITPLSGALEQLLQLHGVTFFWRDPATQGGITGPQMGLIADDVQRVFPQWVGRDPKGYQTLTVGGFEALTAEALRELRAEKDRQLGEKDCEIENLGSEISNLKSEITELKEIVKTLQQDTKENGDR